MPETQKKKTAFNSGQFRKTKRVRVDREGPEQEKFFNWLKFQYPELNAIGFHVPNGGDRHAAVGKKMKREGVKPGVPDIFILSPKGGYFGLIIEMKAPKPYKSQVSADQKKWLARLQLVGFKTVVCRGHEEAKKAVFDYVIADEVPY